MKVKRIVKTGYPALFLCLFAVTSCTTSAWIQQDEPVVNRETKQVLQESMMFYVTQEPRPRSPVLSFDIVIDREVMYNEQLLARRYIQQYKPRYGVMALGLTAMTMGLTLANTSAVEAPSMSSREKAILNTASLAIGLSSVLAMKPDGEPRSADEERFMQRTGYYMTRDTIPFIPEPDDELTFSIFQGDDTLVWKEVITLEDPSVSLNVIREAGIDEWAHADSTDITLGISFRDIEKQYIMPVRSIMQEYIVVTAENTAVRTAPVQITGNIIRHAGENSYFPLLRIEDNLWYRILKRGEVAYIQRDDTKVIWKPAEELGFDDRIVQSGQPVFGDLEIERNLPDNRRVNPEAIAVVIVNGAYLDPIKELPFAERTGELVRLYLSHVMGYYNDNILVFEDMTQQDMEALLRNSDSLIIGGRHISLEESDLFVYYYGHAMMGRHGRLFLLPVDYQPDERQPRLISFDEFITVIETVQSKNTIVIMDTDCTRYSVFGETSEGINRPDSNQMEEFSGLLAKPNFTGGIFWASQATQQTGTYLTSDGRSRYPYDIFTWYFFEAIKQELYTPGEIMDYLEYHVPFTSRRIHDRPQNPIFLGNKNTRIVP